MNNIHIKCLGSLTFEVDVENEKESIEVKWRTAKAKELFCFLLHNRGENVNKEKLIDLLWPSLNADAAFAQLYSSIYSIRVNFEKVNLPIIIKNTNDGYLLDTKNIIVDVDEFEKMSENLLKKNCFSINCFQEAFKIYKADYLENEYYSWAFNKQEQLQLMLFQKISQATAYYEKAEDYLEGIILNTKVKEVFPEMTFPYENLIRLYKKVGHIKFSNRCKNELEILLESERDLNNMGSSN